MFMAGQSKTMDNRGDMTSRSKAIFERKITDLKEARLRNRSSQSNQRQGFNTSTGLVVCIENGNGNGSATAEET